ncbi:hypothetical protein BDY17DRAFT_145182 [Neohortaea acidophila]|uniref:Uncharacterized protein n=1 Tax=Neohortaea acidophila TaxID=245834 RepID=A0A6A6PTT8_9PEZI|nr:uncharacterized protein BDY17DRAFT_145182 [Neohortaea acidophila]KAF2483315.1 hypothetical protein BDY17DRAFT_145182 [Neohortaea acidophila]
MLGNKLLFWGRREADVHHLSSLRKFAGICIRRLTDISQPGQLAPSSSPWPSPGLHQCQYHLDARQAIGINEVVSWLRCRSNAARSRPFEALVIREVSHDCTFAWRTISNHIEHSHGIKHTWSSIRDSLLPLLQDLHGEFAHPCGAHAKRSSRWSISVVAGELEIQTAASRYD